MTVDIHPKKNSFLGTQQIKWSFDRGCVFAG